MKEAEFIRRREAEWEAWDRWLGRADVRRTRRAPAPAAAADPLAAARLPAAFRRLCQDLSLARDRNYSSRLVHTLHDRVLAAQQHVYGAPRRVTEEVVGFLAGGLPRLVRAERRRVIAAALLLFLPLLAWLALLQLFPEGVYLLLSGEDLGRLEAMYSPSAERPGRRAAGDDLMMLMYYIANNVRIDFQCFAGGIAYGIGSVFFLVYNGMYIGAVAGHLTQIGYGTSFWGFVAGHSAPELLGAVLSGAAGLKIGGALIAPGRLTRLDALRRAGHDAVRLLYGAAALTFAAAFIESLWSPLRLVGFEAKLFAGGLGWLLLIAYFCLAGRARAA